MTPWSPHKTRAKRITAQAAASDLQTIANHLQQTVASVVSPSLARDASGVPVALAGLADASALVADAWEGCYRFRYPSVFAAEPARGDELSSARERLVGWKVARKLDHMPLGPLVEHIPATTLSRDEGEALRQRLEAARLTTVGSLVRASRAGTEGLDPTGSVNGVTLAKTVAATVASAGGDPGAAQSLGYAVTLLRGHLRKETQVDLADIGLGSNSPVARTLRVAICQTAAAEDGGSLVKEAYTSADQELASISHELFAVNRDEDKTVAAETAAIETLSPPEFCATITGARRHRRSLACQGNLSIVLKKPARWTMSERLSSKSPSFPSKRAGCSVKRRRAPPACERNRLTTSLRNSRATS